MHSFTTAVLASALVACVPPSAPPPAQPVAPPAPPRSTAFDHTPEALEHYIACATQGFSPEGPAKQVALDAFAPVQLELRANTCYREVVRFGDARLSPRALAGVTLEFTNGTSSTMGGPGMWGPGGVSERGCVVAASRETFDIKANWNSASDPSHVHELGSGTATLQLFSRPLDHAQSAHCKQQLDACLADWRAAVPREECEGAYESCLVHGPTRASACRQ